MLSKKEYTFIHKFGHRLLQVICFDEFEFLSMALNTVVVLMLACNLHKNAADRYAVNNAQDAYACLFHTRHAVFHVVNSWEFVRCFFHLTFTIISYADYLQLVFFTDKYLCWNHAAFGQQIGDLSLEIFHFSNSTYIYST